MRIRHYEEAGRPLVVGALGAREAPTCTRTGAFSGNFCQPETSARGPRLRRRKRGRGRRHVSWRPSSSSAGRGRWAHAVHAQQPVDVRRRGVAMAPSDRRLVQGLVGGATGRPAQPLTQWQQLPENARSLPASPGPGRVPKCLTRLSTSRVVQRGKLSITPHSLL